jgi:hypothetical protein
MIAAWGEPAHKSNYAGDVEYWDFDLAGAPRAIFRKQVLHSLDIYLKDCTVGEIALRLGPPERVAITILVNDVNLSMVWTTQKFYFSSPGFSYFRECEKTEECFIVHSGDVVDGREFFRADMPVADSKRFNMATYVYKWHGFDANMEQIENKIPDFRP